MGTTSTTEWGIVSGLRGKTALVFGSSDGIGQACALALAGAGANVACFDLNHAVAEEAAGKVEELGVRSLAIQGDVSSRDAVRAAVARTVEEFGGLDVCIDVVGVSPQTPIIDGNDEAWDITFDLNLRQAYIVAGEVARVMRGGGGGAIGFVSSVAAATSMPNKAAYGAAKAGLISLMKTAAVENAPHGIRVNAVAPGVTMTPSIKLRDAGALGNAVRDAIPMGRGGETSEIANAMLFLVSDLASYVTGQVITVDGGSTSRYALPVTTSGWKSADQIREFFSASTSERLEKLQSREAKKP